MATYGSGSLSWERFWLLEGRAIPFEVAHATGNVVLALAAGPAMIRMLIRFRERFEWRRGEVGARGFPDEATRRRQPEACQLTREALERLADDLVASVA